MAIINGTDNGETLDGTADADTINGFGGDDILNGGEGDDVLDGGAGSDTVNGGGGNDTAIIVGGTTNANTPNELVSLGLGIDHLIVDFSQMTQDVATTIPAATATGSQIYFLIGGVYRLNCDGIERMTVTTGSGNDTVVAFGDDDLISTGSGGDLLVSRGGPGRDRFDGGAGIDRADNVDWSDLGSTKPVVYDANDPAGVTIIAFGVERYLRGIEQLNYFLTGAGNDIITLHNNPALRNDVRTGAGDDIVTYHGPTTASFGYQASVIDFGIGDDLLIADLAAATDRVDVVGGEIYMNILSGVSVLQTIGAPRIWVTTGSGYDNVHGSQGDDVISTGAGHDYLNGEAGADRMSGGTGNDIYVIDNSSDRALEAVGEGYDVVYAQMTYVLDGGSEIELLSASDTSSTSPIILVGNEYGQTLRGNNGDNYLDGAGGVDGMVGYEGDDIYVVDNAADFVVEYDGEGFDTIYTTTSYMLNGGAEIEVLSARDNSATYAINLTGNEYGNNIYGNNGVNILNGLGGNDAMIGFGGNDIFVVDSAADIAFEFAGQGFDAVYTSTSYMLNGGSEIELLSASDSTATNVINLTGNEYGNNIYGNNGVNILNGLGGNDVMLGFGGNDIFIVDSAGDVVYESAGQGADTVYALTSYALTGGSEVETLSVTDHGATGAINLTGNEYGNSILGNNGSNMIDGKGGYDWLYGFGGTDSFAFTTALAGNIDVLADFAAADDTILLENAVFTGLAAGALGANAFVVGAAALDADDRIIYNQATGALLFDADGSGGIAAVQFAQLLGGQILTASDFTVI